MEVRDFALEYGNRCRQIRQAKGISQEKLGELLGTTGQNVSRMEKNGIKNVNDLMRISEVLGQDVTADQIDQEGSVGEIGQEILALLVRNNGYIEFNDLVESLYGMSSERVAGELFKLERIGNIIREQYTDYGDNTRDGIFITAKGMITIKNIRIFGFSDEALNGCYSYERNLDKDGDGGKYLNIQEKVDDNDLSKMVWKLSFMGAYRVDYLCYIFQNYKEGIPMGSAERRCKIKEFSETLITGENAFIDILYRMVLGLSNGFYPASLQNMYDDRYELENRRNELHRKLSGFDNASYNAQRYFEEHFSWIVHDDTTLTSPLYYIREEEVREDMKEDYLRFKDLDELYYNQIGEDYELWRYEDYKGYFHEFVPYEREERCLEWFDKEEVEAFITENYLPAKTEQEKDIDRMIEAINEKYPETLDYFYHFPHEWEENGLAKMIRGIWNIPEKVEEE